MNLKLQPFLPSGFDPQEGRHLLKETIDLAWPATVESIFVGLASLVDTIMVSTLGTTAIAAIGLTNQPKFIAIAFIASLNVGITAIISRRIGANRLDDANTCLRQSLLMSVLISALVCGLSFLFARPYIQFAGAQADTIDLAVQYFRIVIVGQFFGNIGMTINAAQRCAGNSKISMRTNLAANGINVVFNYLLIGGHFGFPRLEVAGAAIATALGCFIAFLMSVQSLVSPKSKLRLTLKKSWLPSREVLAPVGEISFSAFVEQLCMRLGFFLYALIVAGLGTKMFATHQICMNICNICFSCYDGFAAAAAALVGQNLGRRRSDRAECVTVICNRLAMTMAVLMVAGLILFRAPLIQMLTADPEIIRLGSWIMILFALSVPSLSAMTVYGGALRGAGDTRLIAVYALVSTTIIRPALSWLLCYPVGLGVIGPWIGLLVDFVLRFVLCRRRYQTGLWKQRVY